MEEGQRCFVIRDLVMDAVADDYESFDSICESARSWDSGEMRLEPETLEIKEALLELVQEGLVDGFVLTDTARKLRPEEVLSLEIGGVYFYLSEAGLANRRSKP